ncbi:MAG TPA: hypothetical protein IAC14_01145 [Candidatus Scybalomonas excrementigallinarum]|nr:hypothetical protein [Candidatus Scybalomonas excrementigallinarum]
MPEQPDKCREHHLMLKAELESFKKEFDSLTKNCRDMHCFFFGGINQLDGHISFVDKVNTLYDNQQRNRNMLVTFLSIFGVLLVSGLVGLGVQLHRLDVTSQNLTVFMENQRRIELDIAQLKAKAGINNEINAKFYTE